MCVILWYLILGTIFILTYSAWYLVNLINHIIYSTSLLLLVWLSVFSISVSVMGPVTMFEAHRTPSASWVISHSLSRGLYLNIASYSVYHWFNYCLRCELIYGSCGLAVSYSDWKSRFNLASPVLGSSVSVPFFNDHCWGRRYHLRWAVISPFLAITPWDCLSVLRWYAPAFEHCVAAVDVCAVLYEPQPQFSLGSITSFRYSLSQCLA